jgi:photosystem II stability/assembly factor-like uncharacterized protein
MVNPVRAALLLAVLMLTACTPEAIVRPTPTPPPTLPAGRALTLSAIQRVSPRVGYIAAYDGTGLPLAKTSDGGTTWQRLAVPADHLTSLRFIDEQVGWAGGFVNRDVAQIACQQAAPAGAQPCKGVVLRTEDGGRTWKTVIAIPTNAIIGEPIRQIEAVDAQRAWVLTLDEAPCQLPCSYLQRTTDGGKTWTTLLHGEIGAIRFASATRGWAALNNTPSRGTVEVRETSDGGTTWITRMHTITGDVFGMDAATVDTAWLLTRDGAYCTSSSCSQYALFRTDNGGMNWPFLGNPTDFATCSGGHLAGPFFASTARGWLGVDLGAGGANVGPGGILQSEDGGRTWRCTTTPPNTRLISAADPLHVWAASEDRISQSTALYTSEDAGATWHRLSLSSLVSP